MTDAVALLNLVLDPGSFVSWDEPIDLDDETGDYRRSLIRAAQKSGVDEAVLTGAGRLDGRPVAAIVSEFEFMAGSIGARAADRIIAAIRRATAEGLPLLASTSSGGTRMQEGTPAFVRMIDIVEALADHKARHLPYLVHMRHPTTGGVLASWGSLGHITIAEPAALVGFLGPRVYEAMRGHPFPAGVQVSDRLVRRGVIDGVLPTDELRRHAAQTLSLMLDAASESTRSRRPAYQPETASEESADDVVWVNIEATRAPDRPGIRDLIEHGSDDTVYLSGTGEGERNAAILLALARLDGVPCVLVGHDRTAQEHVPLGPDGLRQARRGAQLAEELQLPLVTVVDTAGADLSEAAELGALAGEIARTLESLAKVTVPTVAVLFGQGTGGGALALLQADTVLATQRSWLAPLPPEGASAILFNTTERAAEMANQQRVSAVDLLADGIVDHVIPEPVDDDAEALCRAVAAEVAARLRDASS